MTIASTLSFANESQFLDKFVLPTLERLGFILIARYHGTREFGKDVVFAELDRFGHVRYHGLQAKYVPSIGLSASRDLIEDCKQAFENPFRHPVTGQNERISSFYAINGGSISDQAREAFFNALSLPFGGNIGLLDAQTMIALNRSAVFSRRELVGERLSAIVIEVRYNNVILQTLKERFTPFINSVGEEFPAGFRLRLNAVLQYLQAPFLQSPKFDDAVEAYCHDASIVNNALTSIGLGHHTEDRRRKLMQSVLSWSPVIAKSCGTILDETQRVLHSLNFLGPLQSAIEPR